MKKAVLVLMMLVGLVGSVFAAPRTKQMCEGRIFNYDTEGMLMYDKTGFMHQYAKPMIVTDLEDKGWNLDWVSEIYLANELLADWKDETKYVDIYGYVVELLDLSTIGQYQVILTWYDDSFSLDKETNYRAIILSFVK